jgi:hypothetical protein
MENKQAPVIDTTINGKYLYNGEDISFDIVETLAHTIKLLSLKEGRSFDETYADFMKSNVYKALTNPESGLWAENDEFIADEYERELNGDTKYGNTNN